MDGLIDYHCVNHHIKMGKFFLLSILFLALIPGVLVTINLGFKNPMVANIIHALIFAFVYSVISHLYWSHLHHKKMKMARNLEQSIMAELQMEQLGQIQMNQILQGAVLQNLAKKQQVPIIMTLAQK